MFFYVDAEGYWPRMSAMRRGSGAGELNHRKSEIESVFIDVAVTSDNMTQKCNQQA